MLNSELWADSIPHTDGGRQMYLDRDPRVFRDLLEYLRYGQVFLSSLVHSEANGDGAGEDPVRLAKLISEADYFCVPDIERDVDIVRYGESVSFRSDQWASFAALQREGAGDDVPHNQWSWGFHGGNPSLLKAYSGDRTSWGIEVGETGTYVVFIRLHSVASPSLEPGDGCLDPGTDEFANLEVLRDSTTCDRMSSHRQPIARCGLFDYRPDKMQKSWGPIQFTACFADILSLRKGDVLHIKHGTRSRALGGGQAEAFIDMPNSILPSCCNRLTVVKIQGTRMARYERVGTGEKQPNVATWLKATRDFPCTPYDPPLLNEKTKIQLPNSGYHLVLGRVASSVKERWIASVDQQSTQLKLKTPGGSTVHAVGSVCYSRDIMTNWRRSSKVVDYGPISDAFYVDDEDSTLSVEAEGDIYLAKHGTTLDPRGKIATQNLCVLRLSPLLHVERYCISTHNNQMEWVRTRAPCGNDAGGSLPSMFQVEGGDASRLVAATGPLVFMVIGSFPPEISGEISSNQVSLLHNSKEVAISEIPDWDKEDEIDCDLYRHRHSFHEIVEICHGDTISVEPFDFSTWIGHLAFVALETTQNEEDGRSLAFT